MTPQTRDVRDVLEQAARRAMRRLDELRAQSGPGSEPVLYRLAATAFAPTTQEIQAVGAEIGQRWLREILETLEAWRGTALGDGLYATEFADPDRAKERLAKEVGDSMAAILNDGPGPRARRFLALSKVNRT